MEYDSLLCRKVVIWKWIHYLDMGILCSYNLSKKHRNVSFV